MEQRKDIDPRSLPLRTKLSILGGELNRSIRDIQQSGLKPDTERVLRGYFGAVLSYQHAATSRFRDQEEVQSLQEAMIEAETKLVDLTDKGNTKEQRAASGLLSATIKYFG